MTKKFIVLDVEGNRTVRPYDVGYIIADKYGKIYVKRSIALPECYWENLQNCLHAEKMTHKNIENMLSDVKNKRTKRKYKEYSIAKFTKLFENDIKKYNIRQIFAYNCNYDKGLMKRMLGVEFFNKIEWCDIMTAVLYTKLLTKKYIQFCKDWNYISPKGNFQYSAEIVYRYLKNLPNFEEEHTGLSDVLIEYEILLSVYKARKKQMFKPTVPWIKLKKFAEENEMI